MTTKPINQLARTSFIVALIALFFVALIILFRAPMAQATDAPFGRLFTTPEQRQSMDYARIHGIPVHPQVLGVDENAVSTHASNNLIKNAEAEAPVAKSIRLKGVLLRADGQNEVWLSGANDRKVIGNILQSTDVKVPLHSLNSTAILKPGQVWNPVKGRAEEAYLLPVPKPVAGETTTKLPPIKARSESSAASSANSATSNSSANSSK